jgi:hypothetical protein
VALLDVGTGYAYSTLNAAITAAPSGGTVRGNSNVGNAYPEAVLINNKRIRLVGGGGAQSISITGAGAGAAPAVQVTGTGGVILENFKLTNVGSSNAYVVQCNVAEDWVSRCDISTTGKYCLYGQYADNLMLHDSLVGVTPSCPGQVIMRHCAAVNMVGGSGFNGNTNNGDFKACFTYNCNTLGFVNPFAQYCCWNFSSDATASVGALSRNNVPLADFGFINYGGGDYRLDPAVSKLWLPGIEIIRTDLSGKRRLRAGPYPRIYAGPNDPYPAAPVWITGTSSIRVITP